jgi:hypothetical protein
MTGGSLTVLDRVRGLIERLAPEPACDDCIARKLELPQSSQANLAVRELAGSEGFERRIDKCALCGTDRTVTRRAAK